MLLHRCAGSLLILVEQQHALGQLAIVQSFLLQHVGCYCLVVAFGHQFLDSLALVLLADGIESVVESELLNVGKVLLLEVGGGHIVVGIDKGEHVLEHAAGCTRCGHELDDAASVGLILFPCSDVLLSLLLARSHDTVAHGCCGL